MDADANTNANANANADGSTIALRELRSGELKRIGSKTTEKRRTLSGWPLVREKSGKFDFSSRSGKSQGILQIGQGNFKYQESQGKVREFHNFGPKYVL